MHALSTLSLELLHACSPSRVTETLYVPVMYGRSGCMHIGGREIAGDDETLYVPVMYGRYSHMYVPSERSMILTRTVAG